MARKISDQTFDLIVSEEVTSKEYYSKYYTRSEWPGLSSGITIGIGYDLGYSTPEEIADDWSAYLPASQVKVLQKYSGYRGSDASALLAAARREINVPWDAAIASFRDVTLPKWINKVVTTLPNTDKLDDDCLGVLVSLAYNRGPAWGVLEKNDPQGKYREMRAIKQHMIDKDFEKIPPELRSMKRLWKLTGLKKRRDREAAIFEMALLNNVNVKPVEVPVPVPAPKPVDVPVVVTPVKKPWWHFWS